MNRTTAVMMAAALVVALAAMPLGAASAFTGVQDGDEGEADDEVQPGERLNGVVGVQQAEIDGEVTERTYGVKIAQAQTDQAKADVVNETIEDVEDRIDDLEDRLAELEEAREDGEITEGQYNAEVAKVVTEKRTAERLAEGANTTVAEHNLEELGVNVEAIGELRERADELGGEEVAEIAQSIAGENVGQSIAEDRQPGAPIDVPGDRDNGADRDEAPEDRDEGDTHDAPDEQDDSDDREEAPDGDHQDDTDGQDDDGDESESASESGDDRTDGV
ncbi:hypothetical protein ACYJ1Y_02405 [Natrialbaceae archaeon A-gly3]